MNKLDVIRKIKKYKEPPYRKDDSCFLRSPWRKFGTMSCIREKWFWYTDETILQIATVEDIIQAYNEITKFYFDKGEDFNMYTSIKKKTMFEVVKDRDVVLGSGNGDSQRYFKTVKDFVDFLNLPVEEEKLDNVEKRYIKDFIRPFRDDITYIKKVAMLFYTRQPKEQIKIVYYKNGTRGEILLPPFPEKSMYKGMKLNKEYTLEELGIKFGN